MSSTPEVTAKVEKDKKTKKEKDLKDDKKDKDEKKEKKSKTEKTKLKDKESPSGSFIGKDFDKKDKPDTVRERGLSKADRTKSPKPSRRHSVNKSTNGEDGEGKILKRTPSFGLLEKRKTCPELDRDDVNFEFSFFDSNDTIVLKDDEKNPFVHWENIVQMGGASRVLESFTKPSQSLNTLCRQYFRELGESKIELLKWIANTHLKGSKQAYLNYLCDHCCFQLKLVEKNSKTDALDITNATHAHLRKDSGGSGHRRSRSIGVSILSAVDDDDISRPLSRSEDTDISGSLGYSSGSHGSSSSRDGTEDDAENAANLSTSPTTYTMMQKRKTVVGSSAPFLTNPALAGQRKTKSVAVRSSSKVRPSIKNATFANNNSNRFATINDEDPNNNNSQNLSKSSGNLPTPTNTKPPILISPPSRTGSKRQIGNTTDPKKADLRAILEALIKQERIQEALECKKYVEILDKLQARQTQYESAKQEDRLHEAIAIRNEVNELIKQYDSLTSAQIAHWIQQDVEGHVTLQEMHELLIDKVGTKKALPFIEEFANANIQSFPPDELEKALEIQQKAKARLKEFQVSEVDEHEKERRRKEEEERWKKEAEERRAQKKKKTKELASIIKVNSNENLLDPPVKLFDQTDQS